METDRSTLKLLIERGPREGDVIEFKSKPGLTIRIGRIVRGNTVAIKDNGISTKHLSIEWSRPGKFIIKDLGSSNGTFLNSSLLHRFTLYDLRDGDELKIGEFTSVRVRISYVSDLRLLDRNPRKRDRELDDEALGVEVAFVDKNSKSDMSLRRSTRRMKNKDNAAALTSALQTIPESSQLNDSVNCEVVENVTRFTQGRKKKQIEVDSAQNVIQQEESSARVLISDNVSQESIADDDAKEKAAAITTDLKNVTLGEWFDILERSFPKQIRAETDQIIDYILKRSRQFHEFVFLQRKQKGETVSA